MSIETNAESLWRFTFSRNTQLPHSSAGRGYLMFRRRAKRYRASPFYA